MKKNTATPKTIKPTADYYLPIHLIILREELDRRIRSNSKYSLRSFAKSLSIDPSLLSKIMQNKRLLSLENATKILRNSNLSDSEKQLFWKSVVLIKDNLHEGIRNKFASEPEEERLLDEDLFKAISAPHHYVLVELSRLKSFKSNHKWISEILGISVQEVKDSIDRLTALQMLEVSNGVIKRAHGRFTTKDKNVTTSANKYQQRKILEEAIAAMDQTPLERRNQSSMTIAVNPKKIPLAKKMIQEFIDQLSNVLETGPLEEVYQISLSMFPVTNLEKPGVP